MKHSPVTPSALVTVAVGGALGALLRWGLGQLVPDGGGFPWTTFAINLSGSFALALLPVWHPGHRRPAVPLFLGPGLLGGYTTLSTYSEQARALLDSGESVLALAYLLGTLGACLVAVLVASRLVGGSAEPEWTEDAP